MEVYSIKNLKFSYPDNSDATGRKPFIPALHDVNVTICEGDFLLLAGPSGCGKSTLLSLLKPELTPYGRIEGDILFHGKSLLKEKEDGCHAQIGFVMQDIDAQLVTDKVWHELAFGLEGMSCDNAYIRRRVAEMCSYFGLEEILHSSTACLSGGQKQLVNLASVMAMKPEVLILDEPTSQLDPIAAGEFINQLYRINQELGTTVIITEHRLEEVLPYCNRMAVMNAGRIVFCDEPKKLGREHAKEMKSYLPTAARIYMDLNEADAEPSHMPYTVNQGRKWLLEYAKGHTERNELPEEDDDICADADIAFSLDEIWFRYDRDGRDILKNCSVKVRQGEICAINGGNGSGKSTLLSVVAGMNRPYRGKRYVKPDLKISMLPQNPKDLFTGKNVRDEIAAVMRKYKSRVEMSTFTEIIALTQIKPLLERHPYDLSGGEQQRLALALVLLNQPDILLLDEPTKGMDADYRSYLAVALRDLAANGTTIMLVSHDIEFCSEVAGSCGMMFDGEVVSKLPVRKFYSGNSYYTTRTARIGRDIVDGAVRESDIIYAFKGIGNRADDGDRHDKNDKMSSSDAADDQADDTSDELIRDILKRGQREKLHISPLLRGIIAVLTAILAVCFYITVTQDNLNELIADFAVTGMGIRYIAVYVLFIVAAVSLGIILYRLLVRLDDRIYISQSGSQDKDKQRWGIRETCTLIVIFIMMPFVIWFGYEKLNDRKYYFISLVVLILAMAPFFMSFERKKIRTRELVTLSVFCALAVAGRAAFFMLPNFNPVMALVIISGVALGGEAGFMVGAVSMLVSNMMFGQGPWTPWQMFAMGLLGLFSGIIFGRRSRQGIGRLGISLYGCISAIVIYGGIMNPASVIMWQPQVNSSMIIAANVTGFPFDVVQATATFIFLWIASKPMLEKIDRVRIKWGMHILANTYK